MKKLYLLLILAISISQFKSQTVYFTYDNAGNQISRANCPGCREANDISNNPVTLADQIANKIQAAPVPVKTTLNVIWDKEINNYITKIEIIAYNNFQIMESIVPKNVNNNNSYQFNMSSYPLGVFYLRFYLTDGSVYSRNIIKH